MSQGHGQPNVRRLTDEDGLRLRGLQQVESRHSMIISTKILPRSTWDQQRLANHCLPYMYESCQRLTEADPPMRPGWSDRFVRERSRGVRELLRVCVVSMRNCCRGRWSLQAAHLV